MFMHFQDKQHPTTNPCGTDFDSDKTGTSPEVPGHLKSMHMDLYGYCMGKIFLALYVYQLYYSSPSLIRPPDIRFP